MAEVHPAKVPVSKAGFTKPAKTLIDIMDKRAVKTKSLTVVKFAVFLFISFLPNIFLALSLLMTDLFINKFHVFKASETWRLVANDPGPRPYLDQRPG